MNGAQLRPTAQVVGAFVALIGFDYDMTDQPGGTAGTSWKIWLVESDEQGIPTAVHGVKIPAPLLPAAKKLGFGQPIGLELVGFSKVKGNQAIIEWRGERLIDAKSGEVLAANLRAA